MNRNPISFVLTLINATYFQNYLTRGGAQSSSHQKSAVSAIFLHTKQQKTFIMIFEKISGFFRKFQAFLYFTFSRPSNHVWALIWSLSNSTKAQGTLLDLHGPKNGAWEANFWRPLVKKSRAGSHHGPNWSILIDRSPDNGQTWVYRLVWGPTDVWFWSNREFLTEDDNCAPPPPRGLLGLS